MGGGLSRRTKVWVRRYGKGGGVEMKWRGVDGVRGGERGVGRVNIWEGEGYAYSLCL